MITDIDKCREIAYFKWLEAGCPSGNDAYFWALAEKELSTADYEKVEVVKLRYCNPHSRLIRDFMFYTFVGN